MQRKDFISLMGGAASIWPLQTMANTNTAAGNKIPAYLKSGDTIGITSPAGYATLEEIKPAVQQIESWGFTIKVGDTIGKRDFTFGGTDEERAKDFQQMLDDENIKAILCARGGYGFVRIIDELDFSRFRKRPKWLIGFSDITVLHSHVQKRYGIPTIHSKMCNSFPDDWAKADEIQVATILSLRNALRGDTMEYTAVPNINNRTGTATGILVGGNLKTIESLSGSNSDINTDGKILFVEDVGEYLYSIDRMFWNLKRSGKLDKLAGLVVGGFSIKPATNPSDEFGKKLHEIVMEKVGAFNYPVCFDFPVGHQKNNYALKCGIEHNLTVTTNLCTLTEIR